MKPNFKHLFVAFLMILGVQSGVKAQEYRSATKPVAFGKAPGLKVKLISTVGDVKTYALIFSKGDEIVSGITEFAQKNNIQSGHYQGIGDALQIEVGWFDYSRNQFLIIPIEPAEVTSFTGDVAWYNKRPVAHTHMSAALRDGSVKGGHLFKMIVGPTFELIFTAEPTPLYKKLNEEFQAGLIDPDAKQ